MRSSEFRSWIVEDEGSIVGVLSRATLERAVADGKAGENSDESLRFSLIFPMCTLTILSSGAGAHE